MNPGQPGPRSYPGTSGNGVRLEYLHVNARKEKHTCPRKKKCTCMVPTARIT